MYVYRNKIKEAEVPLELKLKGVKDTQQEVHWKSKEWQKMWTSYGMTEAGW